MKILISGNDHFGLSAAIGKLYPGQMTFASRANDYDLCTESGRDAFSELSTVMDVVIISAALYQFQQTVLLEAVSRACRSNGANPHIITIGSTADRMKNGRPWLYPAEKKALRDYSNTLSIGGVWSPGLPKVTYVSFGTLSNNAEKHPDRTCMDMDEAAKYIEWVILQPEHININEISIDPMQRNHQ